MIPFRVNNSKNRVAMSRLNTRLSKTCQASYLGRSPSLMTRGRGRFHFLTSKPVETSRLGTPTKQFMKVASATYADATPMVCTRE